MTLVASGMWVLVIRRGGAKLLLQARERSRGLLFHEGFRSRPRLTGPRPDPGYQSGWVDDMFPLPSAGTHEAELSADTWVLG